MLLCPLLFASGIGAGLVSQGGLPFALVLGVFLLTMAPLVWRALRKDRTVGFLAPLFIASRALALSGGAAVGVVSEVWRSSVVGRIVSTFYRKSSSDCSSG